MFTVQPAAAGTSWTSRKEPRTEEGLQVESAGGSKVWLLAAAASGWHAVGRQVVLGRFSSQYLGVVAKGFPDCSEDSFNVCITTLRNRLYLFYHRLAPLNRHALHSGHLLQDLPGRFFHFCALHPKILCC